MKNIVILVYHSEVVYLYFLNIMHCAKTWSCFNIRNIGYAWNKFNFDQIPGEQDHVVIYFDFFKIFSKVTACFANCSVLRRMVCRRFQMLLITSTIDAFLESFHSGWVQSHVHIFFHRNLIRNWNTICSSAVANYIIRWFSHYWVGFTD